MTRKSGSALLIVLGFLSFMVVSAVAFSIYMRSERVPSSVYRRGVQSRQLVKAALARAMSELDDCIRADPFPGVTDSTTSRKLSGSVEYPKGESGPRFADSWYGRVFMPPNPDILLNGSSDGSFMASEDDTVSVVTLEGLGYLPPPLINDVRFLARGSWSSKWRMFNYGAGRYAYCAVNVSDYPDIVRVVADATRSSGSRINLSSLFADKFDSQNVGVSAAEDLADFVRKRGGGSVSTWPFVSMLDYALAMRNTTIGGVNSTFYRWCAGGRTTMYDAGTQAALKNPFVTDSWLPDTALNTRYADKIVDLNDRQENDNGGQPFPTKDWMQGGKSFTQIGTANSSFCLRTASGKTPDGASGQNKSMLELTYALLYDYLDRDDMPISLALPCVERVPMVTAIEVPNFQFQMGVQANQQAPVTTSGANSSATVTETFYEFDQNIFNLWKDTLRAKVAFVFPFKRGKDINRNFKARVFFRAFLVENGAQGLRIANDTLRPSTDHQGNDWNTPTAFAVSGGSAGLAPIVFTFVSDPVTITPPADIEVQKDAVFDKTIPLKSAASVSQRLISKRETSTTPMQNGVPTGPASTSREWKFDAAPLKTDGSLMNLTAAYIPESQFQSAYGSLSFTLQAAMWVLIEDSNGDVVDLVPALGTDDNLYNNVNNGNFLGYQFDGNGEYPLFRFKSLLSQSMPTANFDQFFNIASTAIDSPQAYFAVDPRYNWAPEDWMPRDKSVTGESWLDWVIDAGNDMLGVEGRDSDIFMFVSNQGFLQSMGELAFLPRVTNFGDQRTAAAASPTDLLARGAAYDGKEHKVSDKWYDVIPNRECVWRTFRPYAENDGASEYLMDFRNFYGTAVRPHAIREFGARGFRVNPYTDNENILMTAFAYTPYDWWAAAGTNTMDCTSSNGKDSYSNRRSMFKDLSDSRKYSFFEGSDEAPMRDEDIRLIASTIRDAIRANPTRDWQDVYDGLNWYGNVEPDDDNSFQNFLGVNCNGSYFHGVDRKYLYAFWRNCLANRQQLFMVFLRAESMALGGSGEGQIPPQQGGHAVALVWRDPENPIDSGGNTISQDGRTAVQNWVPHRMRVLFFHQFD